MPRKCPVCKASKPSDDFIRNGREYKRCIRCSRSSAKGKGPAKNLEKLENQKEKLEQQIEEVQNNPNSSDSDSDISDGEELYVGKPPAMRRETSEASNNQIIKLMKKLDLLESKISSIKERESKPIPIPQAQPEKQSNPVNVYVNNPYEREKPPAIDSSSYLNF